MNKSIKSTLLGGIVSNPVFILVLGMCPSIAISKNVLDSFYLGVATLVALIASNAIISALRKVISDKIRLPAYIVIIASIVTALKIFLKSTVVARLDPNLWENVGAFVELITVNCIIFARAEVFANKNKVGLSILDGFSMGMGFLLAICFVGAIRQFMTDVLGFAVFGQTAGGFLVLGFLMAMFNFIYEHVKKHFESKSKNLPLEGGVA